MKNVNLAKAPVKTNPRFFSKSLLTKMYPIPKIRIKKRLNCNHTIDGGTATPKSGKSSTPKIDIPMKITEFRILYNAAIRNKYL